MTFRYVKFVGKKLDPRKFGDKEPTYEEVCELYSRGELKVNMEDYVSIRIYGEIVLTREKFDETIWLSKNTYNYVKEILAPKKVYYKAYEGVTFTSARGAWIIKGKLQSVEPLPGYGPCVRIRTKLLDTLGLDPVIVEKRYVFKGFKGEDLEIGHIKRYRYFIAAYKRNGSPLSKEELEQTLLWNNYIRLESVFQKICGASKHLKSGPWHLERMRKEAIAECKVVWRDVAKEFVPAIVDDGAIPDYTVNYIITSNLKEAYYLLAILLSPQINAVVKELSPWIGHVQPRFIRYFKIPKYNPNNNMHIDLAKIGEDICNRKGVNENQRLEIEELYERIIREGQVFS